MPKPISGRSSLVPSQDRTPETPGEIHGRPQALRELLQRVGLNGRVTVGGASAGPSPSRPGSGAEPGSGAGPGFASLLAPLGSSPLSDSLQRLLVWREMELGQLIELGGVRSSGRTALAYRTSVYATLRGELVGWIDTADALDPRSLARAGADLRRLLWVRPARVREAFRAAELLLKAGFAVLVLDLGGVEVRAVERLGNAPWSRLQREARARGRTILVLSRDRPLRDRPIQGESSSSGAFSTLRLFTERRRACFEWGLFEGFEASAHVVRWRAGPPGERLAFHLLHRSNSVRTELT